MSRIRLAGQSLTEYRQYTLHGLLLFLPFLAVLSALIDPGGRVSSSLVSTTPAAPRAAAKAAYLKPSVVVSTVPGIMARHQAEARATGLAAEETPGATATPGAGGSLVSSQPAQPQQAFMTYTIRPGDTISSIAAAFGVSEEYILWNNPEVSADPDMLLVGQNLLIPSVNGLVYHVAYGDTLSDIAAVFQIDVQSIIGFVPNGLSSPDALSDGMVLLLPGAVPPPPIPAAVAVVEDTPAPEPPPADTGSPLPVPASAGGPVSSLGYIWPFYGNISTYFGEPRGYGYHKGIDIDGFGAYGAPIAAAASGTVLVAAWDDWGLGYHVKIQHDDGSVTVYGHMSEIWVAPGQYVSQGEAVGALGSTGYSTGPHLHFELWIGGVPVDPLAYLP